MVCCPFAQMMMSGKFKGFSQVTPGTALKVIQRLDFINLPSEIVGNVVPLLLVPLQMLLCLPAARDLHNNPAF